jgi:putative endonuclease
MSEWYVYLVECRDGTYYTGCTTDIKRRLDQHNAGMGAKYTRGRGPVQLIAERLVPDQSTALRLEAHVKRQRKEEKRWTINYYPLGAFK